MRCMAWMFDCVGEPATRAAVALAVAIALQNVRSGFACEVTFISASPLRMTPTYNGFLRLGAAKCRKEKWNFQAALLCVHSSTNCINPTIGYLTPQPSTRYGE